MSFSQRSGASLTLIAADIVPALNAAVDNGEARWPVLAKCAARGMLRRVDVADDSAARALSSAQGSVLEALALQGRMRDLPSAALIRTGETGVRAEGVWAHLQCVHFAAGLSDLAAASLRGAARLTDAERAELGMTLAEHFDAERYELHPTARGDWLVKLPQPVAARTVAPEYAFQSSLAQSLPQGEGAAALRRLLTEAQMLLHEHPVNQRRERQGLPTANAVWLWGAGALPATAPERKPLPLAFANDPFLKGLYLLYGESVQAVESAPECIESSAHLGADRLVVADIDSLDALEAQWLPAVLRALRRGVFARATLHLGEWRIGLQRTDLLRFWKGARAPRQWGA